VVHVVGPHATIARWHLELDGGGDAAARVDRHGHRSIGGDTSVRAPQAAVRLRCCRVVVVVVHVGFLASGALLVCVLGGPREPAT
jgi:hypothetical protein